KQTIAKTRQDNHLGLGVGARHRRIIVFRVCLEPFTAAFHDSSACRKCEGFKLIEHSTVDRIVHHSVAIARTRGSSNSKGSNPLTNRKKVWVQAKFDLYLSAHTR